MRNLPLAGGDAAGRARGPVSRRGALAAGLAGALGATAAATVGTAAPADAANPPVLLSQDNTGPNGHRTAIFVPNTTEVASLGDSGSTIHNVFLGVYGIGATAGVRGDGAVAGATGVQGYGAGDGDGVAGTAGPGGGSGVLGLGSLTDAGVAGFGSPDGVSSGPGVAGVGGTPDGHGVTGLGNGTGAGVFGSSNGTGAGVFGLGGALTDGVQGQTGTGAGVNGRAVDAAGVGVLAENTVGGTALQVNGPAAFTRAGTVSIPYPSKSATVTIPGGLSASALVLATAQNNVGVYVVAAVPSTTTGTVKLTLNKAAGTASAPQTAIIAWFVVN
jgi:hypothetical protein